MTAHLPRILVFLPAQDEADAIGDTLRRLDAVKAARAGTWVLETLLVDDGSRDDETVRAAREGGIDHVTRSETPRGLGAATRTGLLFAWSGGYDAAVKLDADGQYDPADIPAVVAPLLADEADLVWGVRARLAYRMPLVRRTGNVVFTHLVRRLTGWPVSDAQTGLMAFSSRFLDGFRLGADYNPPQLLLLDGAARGLRYAEVAIEARARETGRSFVTWRYPFRVATNILRFHLTRRSPP